MREIEKKVCMTASSLKKFFDLLEKNAVALASPVQECDSYFRSVGFRERIQTRKDYLARIRRSKDKATLNVKMLTDLTAVVIEHETTIENPEAAESILFALGSELACKVTKVRRRASLLGVELLLDEIEELGCYLELSVEQTDDGDPMSAIRTIDDILRLLDVDPTFVEARGYPDIILESQGVRFTRLA